LVQITLTDVQTRAINDYQQISTCGYSPVATILATATAIIIAIEGIVIGTFRYSSGMPLVSSCSAAISAA
jgi:hypothetical protein